MDPNSTNFIGVMLWVVMLWVGNMFLIQYNHYKLF